jgi:hypothetical protein
MIFVKKKTARVLLNLPATDLISTTDHMNTFKVFLGLALVAHAYNPNSEYWETEIKRIAVGDQPGEKFRRIHLNQ